MDDDTVLRALSADLERDDPALAALLSDPPAKQGHHHATPWILLVVAVVAVGIITYPTVTLGVLAMLLVLASPLVACWWCALPGDGPTARPG